MIPVVGAGFARMMKHPLQLGPYAIPKNTLLWVPLHALHNSPALWDEPDTYRPVRHPSGYLDLIPFTVSHLYEQMGEPLQQLTHSGRG